MPLSFFLIRTLTTVKQRSRWGGAAARRAAWRGLPVGGNLVRAARSPGDAPACPGAQRAPRLLCLGPRRSRRRRIEKGRCSSRMRPGNGRCWRAERPAVRRPGVQLDFCAPAALPERCQPPTPAALSRVSQQPDASSHTRGGATVRTCNAVLYVLPGLLQPTARQ